MMRSAAARSTSLPVATEPQKARPPRPGWLARCAPVSAPKPLTTFTTPGGKPTSSDMRATRSEESGVSADGLTTTALPTARAGATPRARMSSG